LWRNHYDLIADIANANDDTLSNPCPSLDSHITTHKGDGGDPITIADCRLFIRTKWVGSELIGQIEWGSCWRIADAICRANLPRGVRTKIRLPKYGAKRLRIGTASAIADIFCSKWWL